MFKSILSSIAVIALSFAAAATPAPTGYVGNSYDAASKYKIFEFTAGGNPYRQLPSSALNHVAWPSAVNIGNTVSVYASELYGGKWTRVRRWTSTSGGAYVDQGVVFAANANEPYGIGPTTLNYDGTTWRLFYLVRGASGPGFSVGLATSTDGINFTRQGIIYTAGAEAPGGMSVSYACTDNGTSYLLLHAYSADLLTATSFMTTATSPDGPYSFSQITMTPSGAYGTVTGTQGDSFVTFTGTMHAGRPIVVRGTTTQSYAVTEIVGNVAYLDRPLTESLSGVDFAEAFRKKAEISFIRKDGDRWVGAVTGYGAFSGVTSEYTAHIEASSPLGPWTIGGGYFLNPYFNSGSKSTENPEPIRTSSDC